MSADFPAAHSMDAVWFAVDEDGQIAMFDTGEAGAMPETAGDEKQANTLYQELAQLPKRGKKIVAADHSFTVAHLRLPIPRSGGKDADDISLTRRGVYNYSHVCDNWIAGPYGRATTPSKPLTLGELPKRLHRKFVKLPIQFARSPFVQPAAHVACRSWESAWLELDGKHVHAFGEDDGSARKIYGPEGQHADLALIFVEEDA